jgi:hypothetical protein
LVQVIQGECDGCVSFPRICALTTFCALCSVLCALCSLLCAVCHLCSVLCALLYSATLYSALCSLVCSPSGQGAHTLRHCLLSLRSLICTVQPHIDSVQKLPALLVCPRSWPWTPCVMHTSCVVDNTALDTKLSMQVLSPFLVSAYLSSLLCVLYVGGVRSANY